MPEADSDCLLDRGITSGPLLLVPDKISEVEMLGINTRIPGFGLSMESLGELIGIIRNHVSLVVSEFNGFQLTLFLVETTSNQTESGCRILINVILLRVVSAMSTEEIDVNIIPNFPISARSFRESLTYTAIDLLLTKLPSRYTREYHELNDLARIFDLFFFFLFPGFLLFDPTTGLGNPDSIDRPTTTPILSAKRDDLRASIPEAVLTVASLCTQQG